MMQDHLSDRVVSLLVNIMPLVYFLINKDGNKETRLGKPGSGSGFLNVGRFGVGAFFAGLPISSPKREKVLNSDKYMPDINWQLPPQSDGKVATMADTMPQRAAWTTSTTASRFKRPFFKWVERIDAIMVPKKDIRRTRRAAGGEENANAAVGDLYKTEVESVLSTHLQWWNEEFWGTNGHVGAPSDVDADVWDGLYKLENCAHTTNVYGGLDRTVANNAFWKGNRDTTARPAVLQDIINDANFVKGLAKKGQGAELLICSMQNFPIFAAEAAAKGGRIEYSGLPDMAEIGFKRPIIRLGNSYCIFDPECPAQHVAVLNLTTWTVCINPDANFTVDEPFDLSKTDGGKDAIKSQIRTEMIVANEAPSLNAYYTAVG